MVVSRRAEAVQGEPGIIEPLCAVFRRALRAEGLKYTAERARVLDAIVRFDGPFQAERLIEGFRAQGLNVSKATVYRTMRLLLDAGIVRRALVPGEQGRDGGFYELRWGLPASGVLVRLDTGQTETVEDAEVARLCERLCAQRGLELRGHRLEVYAVSRRARG